MKEDETQTAVEKKDEQAAAHQADTSASASTQDDAEAKIAALEAEKENYRKAFLKEKNKNRGESSETEAETEDDKLRRIVREEQASAGIARVDTEKEDLLRKLAKENKELKLAHMNKPDVSASSGTHSESQAIVRDATLSPDQEKALREQRNWSDKDIERYKKNLNKNNIR